MPKAVKFQPFIREEVLVGIYHVCVLSFFPSFSIYFPGGLMLILAKLMSPRMFFQAQRSNSLPYC